MVLRECHHAAFGQKVFFSVQFKTYYGKKKGSLVSLLTSFLCFAGLPSTWGGRELPSSSRSSTECCGSSELSRGSATRPSPFRLLLGACLSGGFITRYDSTECLCVRKRVERAFIFTSAGIARRRIYCGRFDVLWSRLPLVFLESTRWRRALPFKAVQAKMILAAAPQRSSSMKLVIRMPGGIVKIWKCHFI